MSSTLKAGNVRYLPWAMLAADLSAATDFEIVAPDNGYITELVSSVQVAIVTGGTLNVKTGDALATTVAGLQQTIADAATKGTRQTTAATAGSSTRYVAKGARIVVQASAAFNGGGAMQGHVTFESADTSPALPAAT